MLLDTLPTVYSMKGSLMALVVLVAMRFSDLDGVLVKVVSEVLCQNHGKKGFPGCLGEGIKLTQ